MLKNPFLFIGYIFPPDEMNDQFSKDELPRVQTLKHNIALLKALEYKNKNINHYVSTKPISDYPLNPTLFTKNKNHSLKLIDKTIDISEVGFINLSLIKVISKFFGVFFLSTKIIISFRKIKFILIYSTDISINY